MNRDEMIVRTITVLKDTGIAKTDKKTNTFYIEKAFRGQISSFGAAVKMGSLLSAVAFFSSKGGSQTDRPKLMEAIYLLLTGKDKKDIVEGETLFVHVAENQNQSAQQLKSDVINATIAIKLAMNAYEFRDAEKDGDECENNES